MQSQIEKNEAIPLAFVSQGSGPPLVILHGLFGSGRNWGSIARELQTGFQVFLLDQRNHGRSPHAATHTLEDLVADLALWQKNQLQKPFHLLGHSMGGLVAMAFALRYPQALQSLCVVDIAPRSYPFMHEKEFALLQSDFTNSNSRSRIDEEAAHIVGDPLVRNFLLTNLERTDSGYEWKINVPVLYKSRLTAEFPEEKAPWSGPTLFIHGSTSAYFQPGDEDICLKHFPSAQFQCITGGGHWLHVSHRDEFLNILKGWLKGFL